MAIDLPSPDDIFKYFEKYGEKRANLTVHILREQQKFIDAWNSEIGKQLLKKDIDDHERILRKIIDETCPPEELAEFRVLKRRIDKILDVINNYEDNIKTIKSLK